MSKSKITTSNLISEKDTKNDPQSLSENGGKQVTSHSGIPVTLSERYKRMHKYTIQKLLLSSSTPNSAGNADLLEDDLSPNPSTNSSFTNKATKPSATQNRNKPFATQNRIKPALVKKSKSDGHGFGNSPIKSNSHVSESTRNSPFKKSSGSGGHGFRTMIDEDSFDPTISALHTATPTTAISTGKDRLDTDKSFEDQTRSDETGFDDRIFEPFPLKQTSSFSPSSVTPYQLKKMDLLHRAKYLAYEKPPEKVMEKISASEKRSRKWLLEKQKERDQEAIQDKKKWDLLHRALEDPVKKKIGEKMAEQAHRRILTKKSNYKSLRVILTLRQFKI